MVKTILDIKKIKTGDICCIVRSVNKINKNGNKYLEGLCEDKTGTLHFVAFDSRIIKKIQQNGIYVFSGEYQDKFKNFKITALREAKEEEKNEYLPARKEINVEKMVSELKNKTFNNNLFYHLYINLFLQDINKIKELPATKYKSFSYKGGLLERNYKLYKQVKNFKDVDTELLEIAALLKDVPFLLKSMDKEGNYNDIGKLFVSETYTIHTILSSSKEFFERMLVFLNNMENSKNNFIGKNKEYVQSIEKEIESLKTKREELIEIYKYLKELIETFQKEGKFGRTKKELVQKAVDIYFNKKGVKYGLLREGENGAVGIREKNITEEKVSLEKLKEKIAEEGKKTSEKLNELKKEIEEIQNKVKEEVKKYEALYEIKTKEYRKYQKDLFKLCHIIETNKYFFNEESNAFPKFKEAWIFANITFAFINIEFFNQEYDKLKDNSSSSDVFSSKFGKYLYV